MAAEFFEAGGSEVAITMTPGENGILQVIVDGKKIFDKKEEGNRTPHLDRVKELKAIVRDKLC
jgi:predicted Rdx family selenoprotein